ncbi:MAG: right-handed parallel beta-helix repeat-containing protein [Bacteroidia bacterium]|nr:right-handed parallel beta-helix repeat-containing protein [Bacteroidia bacterium]
MKNIKLLVLMLCIYINTNSQTIILGGNVSGNWPISGSPYLIHDNITIPNGSTLTISPGVIVEFQGHYKLNCNGRILALGNISNGITFTVSSESISTGWWGIRFDNTSSLNDSSKFEFCSFLNGNAYSSGCEDGFGGAIYIFNFSKCVIRNSFFSNNRAQRGGGSIFCSSASVLIENNTFNNLYSPVLTYCMEFRNCMNVKVLNNKLMQANSIYFIDSDLTIIGNFIWGNLEGSAIRSMNSRSLISNNVISWNNTDAIVGGGGIRLENSNSTIINNKIFNNVAHCGGGISCFNSNAEILNNLIANNESINGYGLFSDGGGGIFCYNSSPRIINNTICNNKSVTDGGGIKCEFNSNPYVQNSIIYGNTADNGNNVSFYDTVNVSFEDSLNDPSFLFCDLEGGLNAIYTNTNTFLGTFNNNINLNPQLESPTIGSGKNYNALSANWELKESSPCINSGNTNGLYFITDIAGNPRVNDTIVDIGAYEYQIYISIAEVNIENIFSLFPNPASSYFDIKLENNNDFKTLKIYTAEGVFVKQEQFTGNQTRILTDNLYGGLYIVKIETKQGSQFKKVIVVK